MISSDTAAPTPAPVRVLAHRGDRVDPRRRGLVLRPGLGRSRPRRRRRRHRAHRRVRTAGRPGARRWRRRGPLRHPPTHVGVRPRQCRRDDDARRRFRVRHAAVGAGTGGVRLGHGRRAASTGGGRLPSALRGGRPRPQARDGRVLLAGGSGSRAHRRRCAGRRDRADRRRRARRGVVPPRPRRAAHGPAGVRRPRRRARRGPRPLAARRRRGTDRGGHARCPTDPAHGRRTRDDGAATRHGGRAAGRPESRLERGDDGRGVERLDPRRTGRDAPGRPTRRAARRRGRVRSARRRSRDAPPGGEPPSGAGHGRDGGGGRRDVAAHDGPRAGLRGAHAGRHARSLPVAAPAGADRSRAGRDPSARVGVRHARRGRRPGADGSRPVRDRRGRAQCPG